MRSRLQGFVFSFLYCSLRLLLELYARVVQYADDDPDGRGVAALVQTLRKLPTRPCWVAKILAPARKQTPDAASTMTTAVIPTGAVALDLALSIIVFIAVLL